MARLRMSSRRKKIFGLSTTTFVVIVGALAIWKWKWIKEQWAKMQNKAKM